MIEQNVGLIRTEHRAYISAKIMRGQFSENRKKPHDALEIWQSALQEANLAVEDCQSDLLTERSLIAQKRDKANDKVDQRVNGVTGKDVADVPGLDDDRQEISPKVQACRARLRSALVVQHECLFFIASAFFQIMSNEVLTKPDSEGFHQLDNLETEYYEKAKVVRKEVGP
jgi:E3 ubiquitin-protein ligase SHPRH